MSAYCNIQMYYNITNMYSCTIRDKRAAIYLVQV